MASENLDHVEQDRNASIAVEQGVDSHRLQTSPSAERRKRGSVEQALLDDQAFRISEHKRFAQTRDIARGATLDGLERLAVTTKGTEPRSVGAGPVLDHEIR